MPAPDPDRTSDLVLCETVDTAAPWNALHLQQAGLSQFTRKTARELDLTMPTSILLSADEVIEQAGRRRLLPLGRCGAQGPQIVRVERSARC
ncbi:hypothetical protein ACVIIW_000337 [Bradyrhizobium sp. USDA 4449]